MSESLTKVAEVTTGSFCPAATRRDGGDGADDLAVGKRDGKHAAGRGVRHGTEDAAFFVEGHGVAPAQRLEGIKRLQAKLQTGEAALFGKADHAAEGKKRGLRAFRLCLRALKARFSRPRAGGGTGVRAPLPARPGVRSDRAGLIRAFPACGRAFPAERSEPLSCALSRRRAVPPARACAPGARADQAPGPRAAGAGKVRSVGGRGRFAGPFPGRPHAGPAHASPARESCAVWLGVAAA